MNPVFRFSAFMMLSTTHGVSEVATRLGAFARMSTSAVPSLAAASTGLSNSGSLADAAGTSCSESIAKPSACVCSSACFTAATMTVAAS